MKSFLKFLKAFFVFDHEYYKNGYWTAGADFPVFIPNKHPANTIALEKKEEETAHKEQKKLNF